jgi:hypothetical protein
VFHAAWQFRRRVSTDDETNVTRVRAARLRIRSQDKQYTSRIRLSVEMWVETQSPEAAHFPHAYEKYGRPVGTRTPDLYRVNLLAVLWWLVANRYQPTLFSLRCGCFALSTANGQNSPKRAKNQFCVEICVEIFRAKIPKPGAAKTDTNYPLTTTADKGIL